MRLASFFASSKSSRSDEPGSSGTLLASAISRAVCFSPNFCICSALGPIKVMPAASHSAEKDEFSLKKP